MPGARLCGPCRAALKRARHGGEADIVGFDDESPKRFGVPAVGGGVQDSLPPQAEPARRRRWPAVVMIASILGAAAYVLPRSHVAPTETRAAPAASASRALARSGPAVTDTVAKASVAGTLAAARATATTEVAPDRRTLVEAAPSRNDNLRGAGAVRLRHVRKHNEIDPTSQPAPPRASAAIAPSPGVSTAPTAPVAIAEVTHTRWQSMDDAMAACRGGFFDRLLCRQKARIAFCDGYWGRVPECATAAATDATR